MDLIPHCFSQGDGPWQESFMYTLDSFDDLIRRVETIAFPGYLHEALLPGEENYDGMDKLVAHTQREWQDGLRKAEAQQAAWVARSQRFEAEEVGMRATIEKLGQVVSDAVRTYSLTGQWDVLDPSVCQAILSSSWSLTRARRMLKLKQDDLLTLQATRAQYEHRAVQMGSRVEQCKAWIAEDVETLRGNEEAMEDTAVEVAAMRMLLAFPAAARWQRSVFLTSWNRAWDHFAGRDARVEGMARWGVERRVKDAEWLEEYGGWV